MEAGDDSGCRSQEGEEGAEELMKTKNEIILKTPKTLNVRGKLLIFCLRLRLRLRPTQRRID
jgi:hypothetical protein